LTQLKPAAPHDVPFGARACRQPDAATQESTVHAFPSSHDTGVEETQLPDLHVSFAVQ
jgi:hypothetical protein